MSTNLARRLLLAQILSGCSKTTKKQNRKKKEHETVQINNVAQTDTDSALDDNLDASVHVDENRRKYRKKD